MKFLAALLVAPVLVVAALLFPTEASATPDANWGTITDKQYTELENRLMWAVDTNETGRTVIGVSLTEDSPVAFAPGTVDYENGVWYLVPAA